MLSAALSSTVGLKQLSRRASSVERTVSVVKQRFVISLSLSPTSLQQSAQYILLVNLISVVRAGCCVFDVIVLHELRKLRSVVRDYLNWNSVPGDLNLHV